MKITTTKLTLKQAEILIRVAAANGYNISRRGSTVDQVVANHNHAEFPSFGFDPLHKQAGCTCREGGIFFEDALLALCKPIASVKLNNEYTAVVSGDAVIVGCQKFPAARVRELVALL